MGPAAPRPTAALPSAQAPQPEGLSSRGCWRPPAQDRSHPAESGISSYSSRCLPWRERAMSLSLSWTNAARFFA